jgi:hypothetical protein
MKNYTKKKIVLVYLFLLTIVSNAFSAYDINLVLNGYGTYIDEGYRDGKPYNVDIPVILTPYSGHVDPLTGS